MTTASVSWFGWAPFPRPGLGTEPRRAQRRSGMASAFRGHRAAARSVLDGREHDANLGQAGSPYGTHGFCLTANTGDPLAFARAGRCPSRGMIPFKRGMANEDDTRAWFSGIRPFRGGHPRWDKRSGSQRCSPAKPAVSSASRSSAAGGNGPFCTAARLPGTPRPWPCRPGLCPSRDARWRNELPLRPSWMRNHR